jgi:Sulfotransferase domain
VLHRHRDVDFRRFFRRYRSAIDWPACEFHAELLRLFPGAKVVLTVREPAAWYESVRQTLWPIDLALPWWFPPSIRHMHDELIWKSRFGGRFLDSAAAIAAYEAHVAEVRRTVPADRLLVFDPADGWAPLCRFLDRPIPAGEAFPRLNDRRFFARILVALRWAEWAVPVAALTGLVALLLALR